MRKICTKCGEEFDSNDFYKRKASRDGLTFRCKSCTDQANRKRQIEHPEVHRKASLKYYRKNLEVNREKHRIAGIKYNKKHPEKRRQQNQAWKRNNPEKCREHFRRWKVANPEKDIINKSNLNSKRRSITAATDITNEWLLQLKENTKTCSLCGKDMIECKIYHPRKKSLDHIILLSWGGTHTKDNVRYICIECNLRRPKRKK
jgi:hypothetical protein